MALHPLLLPFLPLCLHFKKFCMGFPFFYQLSSSYFAFFLCLLRGCLLWGVFDQHFLSSLAQCGQGRHSMTRPPSFSFHRTKISSFKISELLLPFNWWLVSWHHIFSTHWSKINLLKHYFCCVIKWGPGFPVCDVCRSFYLLSGQR